jgi:cytochrome P450
MPSPESNSAAKAASIQEDSAAISDTFGNDIDDPHAIYRELRRSAPVMEGDILAKFNVPSQADYANRGRRVFTLFRYEDVMAVLRDVKTYTSSLLGEGIGQFLGGFMLTAMDGDEHKLARALLAPAFSPTTVAKWRDRVKPVIRSERIEPLTSAKRCDLIAEVLLPLPIRVIYEILGFPPGREQAEQFAAWAMRILVGPQRDPEKAQAALKAAFQASQDIYDHVLPLVRRKRAQGGQGDDLIAYLLRASYDGRTLTDEEITSFIRQLLPAAAETTTRSFGSMLTAILQRPALLERVRGDRALVPKVVEEGMRWETAAQFLARECARDVEIRGVKVPQGASLSLACGSANRDEEVFSDPDEFDIDRPRRPHAGFGGGAHTCLGHMVAKMEMESMLNAMLDAWPNLRLDPNAAPPRITGVQLRGPRVLHVIWD